MSVVYFDCFAGISGDMIIGAQLDLGLDFESLKSQLSTLGLQGYEIKTQRVQRGVVAATKFDVDVEQRAQPERTLADIRRIIETSSCSASVKAKSIKIFERLADAEARVHATSPESVHFHEVGAVDSIIDIVGAVIGFELLGVERFFCSPMRVGSGFVDTQHGRLPIPAPATAQLLRGAPLYAGHLEGEFVTPTGASIVATLCERFGPLRQLTVNGIGYGAGTRDPNGFPNALRLVLGEMQEATAKQDETIVVVETNIDDMNPQVYGYVMERAFEIGALDVFMVPAQMKKDRPGVLLSVLCKPEKAQSTIEMLLVETTTLGVRYYEAKRRVLERTIETIDTKYGPVRIKVARDGARTLHFQPEYEDCVRLAVERNVPLLEVHSAATAAYKNKDKASE